MRLDRFRRTVVLAAAIASLALLVPTVAVADDDEREVRKAGICTGSSRVMLRLEAEDGEIEIELEIRTRARTRAWRVVLVHERRVAFHGLVRPRGDRRSVRLRRTVPDWYGRNTIVIRANGPGVESCRVAATV